MDDLTLLQLYLIKFKHWYMEAKQKSVITMNQTQDSSGANAAKQEEQIKAISKDGSTEKVALRPRTSSKPSSPTDSPNNSKTATSLDDKNPNASHSTKHSTNPNTYHSTKHTKKSATPQKDPNTSKDKNRSNGIHKKPSNKKPTVPSNIPTTSLTSDSTEDVISTECHLCGAILKGTFEQLELHVQSCLGPTDTYANTSSMNESSSGITEQHHSQSYTHPNSTAIPNALLL